MNESNQVILLRYFKETNDLDVYSNGKRLCTFENALHVPYKLVELLEKLGYSTFEKQQYEKRWYSIDE